MINDHSMTEFPDILLARAESSSFGRKIPGLGGKFQAMILDNDLERLGRWEVLVLQHNSLA
jgi:tRNA A22 N-methylase